MKSATDRDIETVELAIEHARKKGDSERIVRLELRRDALQAKAFRALQRKIRGMKK